MTRKFKRWVLYLAVSLAIVLCLSSAFSVSYAKWQAPESDDLSCSLGIGLWGDLTYTLENNGVTTTLAEGEVGVYSASFKAKAGDKLVLKANEQQVGYTISGGGNLVTLGEDDVYTVADNAIFANMNPPTQVSYKATVSGGEVTFEMSIGSLSSSEMQSILGGKNGLVTSSGQVVIFENDKGEVTLAPGESFSLCLDKKVISNEFGGGTFLGATIEKPASIEVSGSKFTATEQGTYEISHEQTWFIHNVNITEKEQPNANN